MRKTIGTVALLLAVILLFAACVDADMTGSQAKQMLECLAQNDLDGAAAYLSPRVREGSHDGLAQIADLLAGRGIKSMIRSNIYSGMKFGTDFTGTEEQSVFDIVLDDGTVCQLQTIYYSGEGFVSFYLNINQAPDEGDTSVINA